MMIITLTLNPAVDKTVTLPVFRIGQVNRITDMRLDPGGKGINVSKVIHSLGGHSIAMGILGGATGEYIQSSLDHMGIEHDFITVPEATRVNMKIVDTKLGTNTDINEPGSPVDEKTLEALYQKLAGRVKSGDIVVLAGKTPPAVDEGIYAQWTHRLHRLGAKVYLDVDDKALRLGLEAKPDLIKPNEEEFSQLMGRKFHSIEETGRAAFELIERGIGQIVISLGARGVLFVTKDRFVYAKGLSVPVISTVGAGDATMAALALGNAKGYPPQETMKLALASGAASVMCAGTEALSKSTVEELVKQVELT